MASRATIRHLLAAERALQQVRRSMDLAERDGEVKFSSEGLRGLDELSLTLQAERFQAEDREEAL